MKLDSQNSNINLRHLRAIHTVWRVGSFAKAADDLGIVPSALSDIIRQIEDTAGGALFDRRTRPPVPTPLGTAFLKDTAHILEDMDQALRHLHDRARGLNGTLNIGASPSTITPLVAPTIAAFREAYPGFIVTLHDDVAEILSDKVRSGELDFAVAGRARSSPDLTQTKIGEDEFGLACHKNHPLAKRAQISLSDVARYPIIQLGSNAGSAVALDQCRQLPDSMRSSAIRCQSTIAQLCLLRAGVGVAILPQNAATLFRDQDIQFSLIQDFSLTREIYVLSSNRRELGKQVECLMGLIKSQAAQKIRGVSPNINLYTASTRKPEIHRVT